MRLVRIPLMCVLAIMAGCSSKKDDKPAAPQEPLAQAEALISQNKGADAKTLLEGYIAKKPADWAPKMDVAGKTQFTYWDAAHRNECYMVDVLLNKDKPTDALMVGSYSKAYDLLARIALQNNQAAAAHDLIDKGLALEATSASLLAHQAEVYLFEKRYEKALEFFRKAVSLDTCITNEERGRAYRGMALALIQSQDLAEAEKALDLAAKFSANHPDIAPLQQRIQAAKTAPATP